MYPPTGKLSVKQRKPIAFNTRQIEMVLLQIAFGTDLHENKLIKDFCDCTFIHLSKDNVTEKAI